MINSIFVCRATSTFVACKYECELIRVWELCKLWQVDLAFVSLWNDKPLSMCMHEVLSISIGTNLYQIDSLFYLPCNLWQSCLFCEIAARLSKPPPRRRQHCCSLSAAENGCYIRVGFIFHSVSADGANKESCSSRCSFTTLMASLWSTLYAQHQLLD